MNDGLGATRVDVKIKISLSEHLFTNFGPYVLLEEVLESCSPKTTIYGLRYLLLIDTSVERTFNMSLYSSPRSLYTLK